MTIEKKLAELGIELPVRASPLAAYIPAVEVNGLLHLSGQLPFRDGEMMTGKIGVDRDIDYGVEAARRCALMLLSQMQTALGSLDRVERIVKLGVFVNCAADFTNQPTVGNGASELLVSVFGESGRHARSAVGVGSLPLNVAVEVDAIVAVRPA